jgi:hypothetical protein
VRYDRPHTLPWLTPASKSTMGSAAASSCIKVRVIYAFKDIHAIFPSIWSNLAVKVSVRSRYLWILIPTVLMFLAACSSTPKPADTASKKEVSATDEQIFVGDSVEMSYDPNVIMKRAESFFDKESYAEAIVEYKHFLDLHRNHILAP